MSQGTTGDRLKTLDKSFNKHFKTLKNPSTIKTLYNLKNIKEYVQCKLVIHFVFLRILDRIHENVCCKHSA